MVSAASLVQVTKLIS